MMSYHRYRDLAFIVDDYVVGISAAVTTASLIVLIMLLARYRLLVGESAKSAQMAKNIWDAMNSRFTITDARIIDLMAKVDVYSVRGVTQQPGGHASIVSRAAAALVPSQAQLPQSKVLSRTRGMESQRSRRQHLRGSTRTRRPPPRWERRRRCRSFAPYRRARRLRLR